MVARCNVALKNDPFLSVLFTSIFVHWLTFEVIIFQSVYHGYQTNLMLATESYFCCSCTSMFYLKPRILKIRDNVIKWIWYFTASIQRHFLTWRIKFKPTVFPCTMLGPRRSWGSVNKLLHLLIIRPFILS